jgi:hypothetical protein
MIVKAILLKRFTHRDLDTHDYYQKRNELEWI